jgi:hypothetical protein
LKEITFHIWHSVADIGDDETQSDQNDEGWTNRFLGFIETGLIDPTIHSSC